MFGFRPLALRQRVEGTFEKSIAGLGQLSHSLSLGDVVSPLRSRTPSGVLFSFRPRLFARGSGDFSKKRLGLGENGGQQKMLGGKQFSREARALAGGVQRLALAPLVWVRGGEVSENLGFKRISSGRKIPEMYFGS